MKSKDWSKVEKIIGELRLHKNGIYVTDLSARCDVKRSTVFYYLFGWHVGEKLCGGFLKPLITESRKEGHNRFIKLRPDWKEVGENMGIPYADESVN